jgi:arsenate reductase (glutaredoxin)
VIRAQYPRGACARNALTRCASSPHAVVPKSAFEKEVDVSATLYGIKNCDTMKKARAWLDGHGVAYAFHDYKTAGLDPATLQRWAKQVGWETLLNRAGTTFRKLPDADKQSLTEAKAIALMISQPSMIKRPVLERSGGKILVGFKPEFYAETLR